MSITGHPNSPPSKVGVPIADLNTGMFAMQGILSAYIHRLKKNEGQYIEVSLLESALAYTMYESSIYFTTGKISTPDGSAHRLTAPYQAFKTKDGYINIGAANQSNWERLLNVLGLENLNNDPEFSDSKSRQVNRKKLEKKHIKNQIPKYWKLFGSEKLNNLNIKASIGIESEYTIELPISFP